MLQAASERAAQSYVDCVKQESQRILGISRDASFILAEAKSACGSQLDAYTVAESELLDTQYMMIDPQLERSLEELNERSRSAVAEMLTAGAAATPAPAASPSSPAVPVAAGTSAAAVSRPQQRPVAGNFSPDYEQRVYLDCMQDQAKKYIRLSETAGAIAEVAASRCRSYLVGSNQAALEQEGRAVVMGTVFDARLEARP